MPKAPPAFQFYAADFLTATAEWTDEEVGIYLRFLLNQWINGSIPREFKRLSMLITANPEDLEKNHWPLIGQKFVEGKDGRLRNARLEEIKQQQIDYRKAQAKLGKKGAQKRWGRHDEPHSERYSDPSGDTISDPNGDSNGQKIALQSSSSFLKKEKRKKRKKVDWNGFAKCWSAYPKKKSKGQAEKNWEKINPGEQLVEKILSTIERAKKSDDWQKNQGEFIPYFSSWLNAKGWEDEFSVDMQSASTGTKKLNQLPLGKTCTDCGFFVKNCKGKYTTAKSKVCSVGPDKFHEK